MKLLRVNIPKSKLDTMPRNEQVFFIQLTHMLNELNILQKCLIISSNEIESLNTVERRGQVSQALFFIRMLAGKLKEAWEILQRDFFSTALSKKFEKLLSELGKDGLSKLKIYFGRKNNIYLIRTEFAFHYSRDGRQKVEREIGELGQNEVWSIGLF